MGALTAGTQLPLTMKSMKRLKGIINYQNATAPRREAHDDCEVDLPLDKSFLQSTSPC